MFFEVLLLKVLLCRSPLLIKFFLVLFVFLLQQAKQGKNGRERGRKQKEKTIDCS